MISLLFAFLFVEETNEIFETLSPMEIQQIEKLPEGERRYLLSCIKNGTFPTRAGWSSLNKGEMFLAETGIRVDQIIDESNFIGFGQAVWVEGINTSNLSDDVVLNTKGMLFLCDGNKQYTTVLGGLKTVMKIIRIRPESVLEVLKAIAEPRGYHVWGEGSNHLVLAKYLRSSSKNVIMLPLTGKRTTIKRDALTPADEKWVTDKEAAKKQNKDSAK